MSVNTKFIITCMAFCVLPAISFALNPSLVYKQLPEKYNMVYTEYKVTTGDGATLNAWYFPSHVVTKQLVLISHNGEGNMADYLRQVDQFMTLGHNVMIYDYRGFGTSSEFAIDHNMYIYPHFQDDLIAMINFCSTTITNKFILYGWGIGAGLSLGIGYGRPEIEMIIADTPFLSMEDLEKKFNTWDTPLEVPFAGYDKKYEPFYTLENEPAVNLKKILLIIGETDPVMKEDDMKLLKAKQKSLIDALHVVPGGDGRNNFSLDKVAYMAVISKFLTEK